MRAAGLALAALALAAAACGGAASRQGTALRKLKVVMLPYGTSAPLLIAKERGFFERRGLDVEWVTIERSSETLPSLVQGRIDVVPGGINAGLVNLVAGGAHLRLVANKGMFPKEGCTGAVALLGRAGLGPWPGSLRGARVSVQSMLFTELFLDRLLAQQGVPRDGITRVDLPKGAVADALRHGTVDYVVTSEPILLRARTEGFGEIAAEASSVLPGFDHGYLVFGPSMLDGDPETGRRFLMAYVEGASAYMEGKTDANVKALAAAMKQDEAELRAQCWMPMRPDLGVDAASVAAFLAWSRERGVLEGDVRPEQLIDEGPLRAARAALELEKGKK